MCMCNFVQIIIAHVSSKYANVVKSNRDKRCLFCHYSNEEKIIRIGGIMHCIKNILFKKKPKKLNISLNGFKNLKYFEIIFRFNYLFDFVNSFLLSNNYFKQTK